MDILKVVYNVVLVVSVACALGFGIAGYTKDSTTTTITTTTEVAASSSSSTIDYCFARWTLDPDGSNQFLEMDLATFGLECQTDSVEIGSSRVFLHPNVGDEGNTTATYVIRGWISPPANQIGASRTQILATTSPSVTAQDSIVGEFRFSDTDELMSLTPVGARYPITEQTALYFRMYQVSGAADTPLFTLSLDIWKIS